MKAFFDARQAAHDPKHFMANGALSPNPEQPERITRLHAGALAAGGFCVIANRPLPCDEPLLALGPAQPHGPQNHSDARLVYFISDSPYKHTKRR